MRGLACYLRLVIGSGGNFVLLLAASPVFGPRNPLWRREFHVQVIHGMVTTLQENTSSGLAGVILKLDARARRQPAYGG